MARHKFEHEDKRRREQMAREAEERENQFECKKCTRKFRTEKSYKMHMQEHEDADDNRKECPKCFRQFMSEASLEVHIDTAHPDFDFNQSYKKYTIYFLENSNFYKFPSFSFIEFYRTL